MSHDSGSVPVTPRKADWRAQGACREFAPDSFYPEGRGSKAAVEYAKQICRICPVRSECREYAITADERWGIWGGLSQNELTRLRRQRARQNVAAA